MAFLLFFNSFEKKIIIKEKSLIFLYLPLSFETFKNGKSKRKMAWWLPDKYTPGVHVQEHEQLT